MPRAVLGPAARACAAASLKDKEEGRVLEEALLLGLPAPWCVFCNHCCARRAHRLLQ